jgi:hypothetical protein
MDGSKQQSGAAPARSVKPRVVLKVESQPSATAPAWLPRIRIPDDVRHPEVSEWNPGGQG